MLAQTVEANSNIAIPNVPAIMCHGATVYWLFTDEFQRLPTVDEFTDQTLSPPAPVIQRMLGLGNQVNGATALNGLTPGTVLVFVLNGEPAHSCVVAAGQRIAGYNQTGWYSSAGAPGAYSSHSMNDVQWNGGVFNRHHVQGALPGQLYRLVAIPENMAKAILRQAVQG